MTYVRSFRIIVPMILTLSLFACKPKDTTDVKKGGDKLAEVNGVAITVDEFKKEAEMRPPYVKALLQTEEGKKKFLDLLINRKILYSLAEKQGVDKSKEVADKLEYVRKELIIQTYLQKKMEKEATVADDEMKKFYEENKDKFKSGDQVKVSQILVRTEGDAREVLKKLKSGESFEALAKKYSIDMTKDKGGDLGWVNKGIMVPEFEKAAFSLKEGETSDIVATKDGFHIIKVTGKRPAGLRTYEEVKDQIKAYLLPEKQKKLLGKMEEEIRNGATIKKNDDALKTVDIKSGDDLTGAAVAK